MIGRQARVIATMLLGAMLIAAGILFFFPAHAGVSCWTWGTQVLHCPWCTSPAFEDTTYFVRTAEDLNVPLADYSVAVNVVELLNRMTRAQSQCDKAGYDLAFDDYAKIVGLGEQVANPDPASETDGVFKLLYPRRDLSSLAEYAVPPFHACGAHRIAGAKANPALASRQGLRWSGR
jgi:hypothetical protein